MSLWHCPEHRLVGPMPCCALASRAEFNGFMQRRAMIFGDIYPCHTPIMARGDDLRKAWMWYASQSDAIAESTALDAAKNSR